MAYARIRICGAKKASDKADTIHAPMTDATIGIDIYTERRRAADHPQVREQLVDMLG
jgi:hypothetical protein